MIAAVSGRPARGSRGCRLPSLAGRAVVRGLVELKLVLPAAGGGGLHLRAAGHLAGAVRRRSSTARSADGRDFRQYFIAGIIASGVMSATLREPGRQIAVDRERHADAAGAARRCRRRRTSPGRHPGVRRGPARGRRCCSRSALALLGLHAARFPAAGGYAGLGAGARRRRPARCSASRLSCLARSARSAVAVINLPVPGAVSSSPGSTSCSPAARVAAADRGGLPAEVDLPGLRSAFLPAGCRRRSRRIAGSTAGPHWCSGPGSSQDWYCASRTFRWQNGRHDR